ncbi:MAG TPA: glycosyltransferase family 4 protein [Tepidisphaeraceae bacterium]|jgi:glycosyltransferase involved in cell wall biosynthesis|nr:glycosyltransferase family 4 protein [Tepidisphaeraceae bacterium]
MPDSGAPSNSIRSLAIVCNALPPYRVHFHQRIVREMSEMKLWTVCTHEGADQPWAYAPPAEINTVQFGPGESVTRQSHSKRAWHEWKKGGKIIEWIKQERIGAVLVNGYNDPARLRILRWCAGHNVPVLLWGDSNIRGDQASGIKAVVKRRVLKRILGWCDGILACGSLGREYFQKYGAPSERIFYSPVEPDYDAIKKNDREVVEGAARQFELARDRRRIVFSGRLTHAKRPDLAVDSFVALANERPNWDLLMVGDGAMREELIGRVPQNLKARVCFTGFIGEQAMVSALYQLSDVLVLPSDYEPWALVINEAVAAGLAVVCSKVVGAAAELVRDEVNGFTFPPGDLAAMVQQLREVTAEGRIEQFKGGSAGVLEDWRRRADPVEGLRAALRYCAAGGKGR